MNTFERPYGGLCIGGPWDNLSMTHHRRRRPIFQPNERGREREIGFYEWSAGEWFWIPIQSYTTRDEALATGGRNG